MSMIDRRLLLASAAALVTAACSAEAQTKPRTLTVYKTEYCGCCGGWIEHMKKAGYGAKIVTVEDIGAVGAKRGVPFQLSSCHVAEIDGYVLVGHIPAGDVGKLLREKPKALGLTVPGMPIGSPGMEVPGGKNEAYDTLLLLPGGKTRVFVRHA